MGRFLIKLFIVAAVLVACCHCLHLKGSWKSREFFDFLAKFGFQQTNMHDKTNTQGYIYGNITSRDNVTTSLTFVVVDSEYFLEFYGNRSVQPRSNACPAMFHKMDRIAWDQTCNGEGQEDFLRKVPCPFEGLCAEEDDPDWVIPGYQFTFRVRDTSQPRFWYVSTVSCYRNVTGRDQCAWAYDSASDVVLDYDIWLVNGHPHMKHINPFEHQFSFEHHDIFEVYLAFFVAYCFLVPIQLYALSKQKHPLPLLLTIAMCTEYVGILFNLIHVLKFAFDGAGVELLQVVGNFIGNVAECLFMLLLLLVVKGWTITRMELEPRAKVVLATAWVTYTLASMGLFIWNLMEVDIISNIDEWQTWPGWLILGFRILIMAWFLVEMRETLLLEHNREKMRFYLHFGAGFLVWFVYLPLVAVICTQVSSLWKYKTILSVTYAADFLSYCVLVHLLWPSRSYMYFNLKTAAAIPTDTLEFAGLESDVISGEDSSSDSRPERGLLPGRGGRVGPGRGGWRPGRLKACPPNGTSNGGGYVPLALSADESSDTEEENLFIRPAMSSPKTTYSPRNQVVYDNLGKTPASASVESPDLVRRVELPSSSLGMDTPPLLELSSEGETSGRLSGVDGNGPQSASHTVSANGGQTADLLLQ